ncbi:MFS transporter [Thermoactinomyces daqus]|uniref:MFS transporter n=1 Tax=Thermoactinomyces daqus TaxID=1329516 RepID=UPI000A8C4515|nr:MFS transporter [Thermoactinomyces daqus]
MKIIKNQKRTKVRWNIAILMWAAIAINYLDRTNISAAAPTLMKEFHLSAETMGLVMSSFFWTYALFQIPAGWFADKVGQRISLAVAVAWWSLATAATVLTRGAASLITTRVLMGIGEAGAYPSNAGVTAKWFPDKERARVSAIFDSGSKVGTALAMPVVVWLLSKFGWEVPFIVSGLIGLVWVAIWWVYYRDPEKHKYVNEAELTYIREGQVKKEGIDRVQPLKWYQLFRYRNIWAMCVGFFMLNYAIYFFITWFPTYLVEARHMKLLTMGFVAMIPPLTGLVAELVGGWFSDYLYTKGVSLTVARKINLVGGMLLGFCRIGRFRRLVHCVAVRFLRRAGFCRLCHLVPAGGCCPEKYDIGRWRLAKLRVQSRRNFGTSHYGMDCCDHPFFYPCTARVRGRYDGRCAHVPVWPP